MKDSYSFGPMQVTALDGVTRTITGTLKVHQRWPDGKVQWIATYSFSRGDGESGRTTFLTKSSPHKQATNWIKGSVAKSLGVRLRECRFAGDLDWH